MKPVGILIPGEVVVWGGGGGRRCTVHVDMGLCAAVTICAIS